MKGGYLNIIVRVRYCKIEGEVESILRKSLGTDFSVKLTRIVEKVSAP